jgi:hypothetical protein
LSIINFSSLEIKAANRVFRCSNGKRAGEKQRRGKKIWAMKIESPVGLGLFLSDRNPSPDLVYVLLQSSKNMLVGGPSWNSQNRLGKQRRRFVT